MTHPFDVLIISIGQILSLLIIVDSLLSFVLNPNHPIREALGRILQPLYSPIRRLIPPAGMFDFSPIILLLLIQGLVAVLTSLF
jgi:YggT family protein